MQYCPKCQIRVRGSKAYCPLCQGELSGDAEPHVYPVIPARRLSGVLAFKIETFLVAALEIVLAAAGGIGGFSGIITILMISALLVWADLWLVRIFRNNPLKLITIETYLAMLACCCADRRLTGMRWAIQWMVPFAFLGLVAVTILVAALLKMRLEEYVIYILIDAVLCLLQLIPVMRGWNTVPSPAVISIAVIWIFTTSVLIFRTREVRSASGKWFHI